MYKRKKITRRTTLKSLGTVGALSLMVAPSVKGGEPEADETALGEGMDPAVAEKVAKTALIDTHEHLIEEGARLKGDPRLHCDDWATLFDHYLNSDMITAGMAGDAYKKFFSRQVDPRDKWKLLEPIWPAVKNTGYGQAVRIAIRELYGVEELGRETVGKVQAGYEKTRRRGFYRTILQEKAGIESCQVNCLSRPFMESAQPTLLMQDLSIVGMFAGPDLRGFGGPTGIKVRGLEDWHRVIDWWFAKYGRYAVAVKSQNAYSRDIDYEQVPAEQAAPIFRKRLEKQPLSARERKALEDHLFWYAVGKATEYDLPVKLHTGYYAGQNYMPLGRLGRNPSSATDLCRRGPETRFVFMHIGYPYYEDMIALAKHYSNAYLDMCWAWIINPAAAKDFLKKYLVTAPANKVLTFGGDYTPVEPVLGHAVLARRGIALALSELMAEGWLGREDALELVDMIMHQNARRIFRLAEKTRLLQRVKWSGA